MFENLKVRVANLISIQSLSSPNFIDVVSKGAAKLAEIKTRIMVLRFYTIRSLKDYVRYLVIRYCIIIRDMIYHLIHGVSDKIIISIMGWYFKILFKILDFLQSLNSNGKSIFHRITSFQRLSNIWRLKIKTRTNHKSPKH